MLTVRAYRRDRIARVLVRPSDKAWLLRDARAPARLLASFDAWAPVMRRAGQIRTGPDARRVLIEYMYKVVGPKRHAALDAKLLTLGPGTKEVIMTIADVFREEGRAKGRTEGRAEGRAEGRIEGRIAQLRSLLIFKFRTLDAASEARLRAASAKAIDGYFRRLLTADSLAEVFEGRARRRAPRPRPRGSRRVRPGRA